MSEEQVFQQVFGIAKAVRSIGSGGTTYKFIQELEKLIQSHNAELGGNAQKYQQLLTQLRLSCITLLSDAELEDILKKQIHSAYGEGVDIKEKIALFFVPYFVQEDHSKLGRIIRSLEENDEIAGKQSISLPDGKTATPTLANWIKDYKATITEDKGTLGLVSYLTKNANAKKLNSEDLGFLKYVFSLYDWLRFQASKTSFIEQTEEYIPAAKKVYEPAVFSKRQPRVEAETKLAAPSLAVDTKLTHGTSLNLLKSRLEKKNSQPTKVPTVSIKMTPQEIEREVETPELPAHMTLVDLPVAPKPSVVPPVKAQSLAAKVETISFAPKPKPGSIPFAKPLEMSEVKKSLAPRPSALSPINVVDDLKKLNLDYLRAGSLQSQIAHLKSQISHLAEANNILPYHVVLAYEESPLFKAYLSQGSNKLGGQVGGGAGGLTKEEFEALADLRREIENL